MDNALTSFLAWAAPIASSLIVAAMTAQINSRAKQAEAKTEAKRRAEAEWRERIEGSMSDIDGKLDALNDATQTTMRTEILHLVEKFLTRGWITPEERASLFDMHKKYAALNANGFIDSYIERINHLPDREI